MRGRPRFRGWRVVDGGSHSVTGEPLTRRTTRHHPNQRSAAAMRRMGDPRDNARDIGVKNVGRGPGMVFHQTTTSAVLLARRRAARDSFRSCLALVRRVVVAGMSVRFTRASVMECPRCNSAYFLRSKQCPNRQGVPPCTPTNV